VPLGQPSANTQFYVLDAALEPVPVGVVGELYIGGDSLAWGYLNRPDLTAERFIPNPFAHDKESASSAEPQSSVLSPQSLRLYKTGDLARYRADGSIEFLGRIDAQVKIRGYRIEPGEIEAVLRRHNTVQDVVVVARAADELAAQQPQEQDENIAKQASRAPEPSTRAKVLVAYVVPKAGPSPTSRVLRGFLRERLPDYMVPAAFVLLQKLPLTPTGKVDRRALPAPDMSRPELGVSYVAPRTPVEQVLTQIWADVLCREQIGIHDNFFDLGGHSLLATRVSAQVRDTLQVELPLRSLFDAPTVAELATLVLQTAENWARVERTAQLLLWLTQLSDDDMETLVLQEKLLSREVA
jgi:acyl carrier protein